MDQTVLVTEGQTLIHLLDSTRIKPRLAMWVHYPDTDTWKLLILPDKALSDKREFYRIIAETITKNAEKLSGLDVSSTEFLKDNHPLVAGMKGFLHMPGLGSAHLSGNTFNGFYLPDGIALRVAL